MKNIHPRGFGAWMWKAQCVHQSLQKLDYGDAIVYADAGCVYIQKAFRVSKSIFKWHWIPLIKMYHLLWDI